MTRWERVEGIDNPRLRGRKLVTVNVTCSCNRKELIIPDSGDGNVATLTYFLDLRVKELIIPDSGDGNYSALDLFAGRARKELIIPDSGDGNL